jgi:WD40 repeat protein
LQLYCSALVFALGNSIVRGNFEGCIPNWIQLRPKVQAHWSAALQTLEGHTNTVTSVAFSPDGKQVVSGSIHWPVRLWDAATAAAQLLPVLQVSEHWVVKGDRNILWLPPDYRQSHSYSSATWNRNFVIGHSSGRISFFRFKEGAKLII